MFMFSMVGFKLSFSVLYELIEEDFVFDYDYDNIVSFLYIIKFYLFDF